jgi:hypothetical protein
VRAVLGSSFVSSGAGFKSPLASPTPSRERFLTLFASKHHRGREKRTIKRGAIIVGEIDKLGFDHETA